MSSAGQLSLFETGDEPENGCLDTETEASLSQVRDRRATRLTRLATELTRTTDPLDQARLAVELRDLAEEIVARCVREANTAGWTWRQIGTHIGVPFQTVFRRYGSPQR